MPFGRAPSLRWAADEVAAQADRWMLWTPLAFGGGCAGYFALRSEPSLWIVAVAALAAVALAFAARTWSRRRGVVILAALVAFAACGLLAAKLRTERVASPIVPALEMAQVDGWVVDVASPGASGGRLLIAPVGIEGMAPDRLPRVIRVTVPREGLSGPGAAARLRATLNPSPAPASPGAYDFAHQAYFEGVGGVGFARKPPQIINLPPPPPGLRLKLAVNAARWDLARKIVDQMSPDSAGLGVAMVTGHEAWIDQETTSAMRDSGLAHIISISGVHMAIVGGFVFLGVRLLIALWPWAALRVPGKKVAAGAALFAVLLYLVVSGAPPPAERSAITAAVAFGAVLFDRRAISLHALAVAALAILAFQPEAVTEPGFQMSFAATAALVALAEVWPRAPAAISIPWPIRLVQGAASWFLIAAATSLVAGLATGPFAIQHFNRVATYGLFANLISEPLEGLVIMPSLALGALAESVGLHSPFLAIAGWGLKAMVAVARVFAQAPHAVLVVPSAPAAALPVAFVGLLWLCLWKGRLRWLGLPLAMAVSLWPRPPAPAAWISADAAAAAFPVHGDALLLRPDAKLFAANLWARRRGLVDAADPMALRDRFYDCERWSCAPRADAPKPRIGLWWTRREPNPEALAKLCANADILVTKAAYGPVCDRAIILRPQDFARGGSTEIYPAGPGRWRFVWAQDLRGTRPWTLSGSGG